MTAYTVQTRTTLSQLCAALWDSQSRPLVIPWFDSRVSVVTPQAPRCSNASRTEMQCLRPLRHSGDQVRRQVKNIYF